MNVTTFNTENAENLNALFLNCLSLTSIDLSNFNTSKVKFMSGIFGECPLLESLDLSNFDTSKVIKWTICLEIV